MSSLIQQLENNEALLLMFLTDELPAEDRMEVEQMLARDAGLRAELGKIEAAYAGAMDALDQLDQDRSAEAGENHAIRQATRAMKQWQVARLARQPVPLPMVRTKVPVWAYPIGVAAMLLIGALIWWGGEGDSPAPAHQAGIMNTGPQEVAVVSPDEKQKLLENSFKGFKGEVSESDKISDAETQASTLVARSDDNSVASGIFMGASNP